MGVSSGRSRVADLAFQVFGRAVHPDWFASRGHARLTRGAWEADLRIIEGGHAITWRAGPIRLTEVLAGPETSLPEPGLLFHSQVRQEKSARLSSGNSSEYQTCFEVERLDPEVFAHLCAELTLDAGRGGLFHRFSPSSRLSPAPLSHLHADPRSTGVSIQTFHTFPEERAIVRTQSLFEIRPTPVR